MSVRYHYGKTARAYFFFSILAQISYFLEIPIAWLTDGPMDRQTNDDDDDEYNVDKKPGLHMWGQGQYRVLPGASFKLKLNIIILPP